MGSSCGFLVAGEVVGLGKTIGNHLVACQAGPDPDLRLKHESPG